MSKLVGITIGDTKGIGIYILIDCWKKNKIKNFILFTDLEKIINILKKTNIFNKVNIITSKTNLNFDKSKFNIVNYKSKSLEENTYKSLEIAYNYCKEKICIGVITLPLRKDLIKSKIDKKFIGHTEFFQKLDKKEFSNMILYHNKIIISPLTTHIQLKRISKVISDKKYLYNKIYSLSKSLINDFNIKKPKMIISGLNPHAGENGLIGKEELEYINPTVKKLRKNGINIVGPSSADSILIKKNLIKYNCFIFLYHDQALIPFKFISQFTGVNYTGNLDIIRTSPDHGTAYELIGKNNISNISLINCYKLIKKISYNQKINDKV